MAGSPAQGYNVPVLNATRSRWCGPRWILPALALAAGATGCSNFTGADGLEVEGEDEVVVGDDDGGPVTGSGASNPAPTQPLTCAYAPPPYGVTEGAIVPVTQSWEGYVAGEDAPRTFNVAELYDCEGSKGYHAIIFDTSQYG